MTLITALNAVTATGAGTAVPLFAGIGGQPRGYRRGDSAIVQVFLTGTATVALQGSSDNTNWVTLQSFTADGMVEVIPPLYLRGNVTARSSGAITMLIDHGTR